MCFSSARRAVISSGKLQLLHRNRKRNPRINIVHISLGTDSDLRFDEERAVLLETVPDNIPIEFLIDPPAEHVEAVLDGFRPHIVIVSGHGHYDDLRGEHYFAAGRDERVPTALLAATCASYGCNSSSSPHVKVHD